MQFNERLRIVRKEFDLTQADIAKACGVGLSTWQAYEAGRKEPSHTLYGKLYQMGVNPLWLIDEQEPVLIKDQPKESKEGAFNPYVMKTCIIGSLVSFEKNDTRLSILEIANHIVDLYSTLLETVPREDWPTRDVTEGLVENIRKKSKV